MGKSIKVNVGFRVAAALASMLLFSVMTTVNIIRIDRTETAYAQTNALLDKTRTAATAHYKWASNLSSALYAGTEFTGSMDPTTCVLGQWLYGEAGTDDAEILKLRGQLETLHKELHGSAADVLEQHKTSPADAQQYYQTTIQGNLTTLVGMLDQVIDRGEALSSESLEKTDRTIIIMHITTLVCLVLALVCLISLIQYVMRRVIKPIITITDSSRILQDGQLALNINYCSDDEIGELVNTLETSMERIGGYVSDINKIMGELSGGNFNVRTSAEYVGDFTSIQTSIDNFTSTMSGALERISGAERRISENAEQLSNSSHAVAQGAT
ncbi:MAG: CZB domain-containing protein, partial [Oscillospiraceae bacterium]|nr:CZB domain-containing protein [Oscillospiraceae bacterium]